MSVTLLRYLRVELPVSRAKRDRLCDRLHRRIAPCPRRRIDGHFRCGRVAPSSFSYAGVRWLSSSGAPGRPGNIRRWRRIRERPQLQDNAFNCWRLAAHMIVDRRAHGG